METSVLLAKIIGPLLFIVGLGLLINMEHYRRMMTEFGASSLSVYMAGTTALLLGLLIVTFHNVWEPRWPAIITILGWLTLIKGAIRVVAPKVVQDRAEIYARNTTAVTVSALILLVLGSVLIFFGYLTGA